MCNDAARFACSPVLTQTKLLSNIHVYQTRSCHPDTLPAFVAFVAMNHQFTLVFDSSHFSTTLVIPFPCCSFPVFYRGARIVVDCSSSFQFTSRSMPRVTISCIFLHKAIVGDIYSVMYKCLLVKTAFAPGTMTIV